MSRDKFIESVNNSYAFKGPSIYLGGGVYNKEIIAEAKVNLSLRMMTRHGLVTGATGSGKTRTLQLLAEQLSAEGVPVFIPDMKGDISGLAQANTPNERLEERAKILGISFKPDSYPIEVFSLTGKLGSQMRATVTEFGPILLSKILELNDTQTGVLTMMFKYADDKKLPIVDFSDLKKVLNYLTEGPGADEIKEEYGKISGSTAGTILRKIVALEQSGVQHIFGERSFDIDDLFQKIDGRGVISLLNVSDIQHQPSVFSTFMLALLAEIYQTLPEAGDLDKPKLVFFLDEAHLLFKDAPKAFLEQIDQIIRLIRSKGVGIFFCTQLTQDVPPTVLSQLGNRVHHVIRAFTPNDVKALKETVNTFPKSEYYEISEEFTQLGIGQAFITVLNEKGIPTETVVTHLAPPKSVMGPLEESQYRKAIVDSQFYNKYKDAINPQSAFELLDARMRAFEQKQVEQKEYREYRETTTRKSSSRRKTSTSSGTGRRQKSTIEQVMNSSVGRQIGRSLVRGVFGMLFGKAPRI